MYDDWRYFTDDSFGHGPHYGVPYYVGAPPSSLFSGSTLAKVAIVAGGALAILFIFRASQAAEKLEPVHERAGRAAGKMLRARYSGKTSSAGGAKYLALGSGSEGSSKRFRGNSPSASSLLGSTDNYKLLSA